MDHSSLNSSASSSSMASNSSNSKKIIRPDPSFMTFDPDREDDDVFYSPLNASSRDNTPVQQSGPVTVSVRSKSPEIVRPVRVLVQRRQTTIGSRSSSNLYNQGRRKAVQFNQESPEDQDRPSTLRRHSVVICQSPPDSPGDSPVLTRRTVVSNVLKSVSRRHSTLDLTSPYTSQKSVKIHNPNVTSASYDTPRFRTGVYQHAFTTSPGNAVNSYTSSYLDNNDPASLRATSYQISSKYASMQYSSAYSRQSEERDRPTALRKLSSTQSFIRKSSAPASPDRRFRALTPSSTPPTLTNTIPRFPSLTSPSQFNPRYASTPLRADRLYNSRNFAASFSEVTPLLVSGLTRTARRLSAPLGQTNRYHQQPQSSSKMLLNRRQLPKVPSDNAARQLTKTDKFVSLWRAPSDMPLDVVLA